jgi:hypothetical protein
VPVDKALALAALASDLDPHFNFPSVPTSRPKQSEPLVSPPLKISIGFVEGRESKYT